MIDGPGTLLLDVAGVRVEIVASRREDLDPITDRLGNRRWRRPIGSAPVESTETAAVGTGSNGADITLRVIGNGPATPASGALDGLTHQRLEGCDAWFDTRRVILATGSQWQATVIDRDIEIVANPSPGVPVDCDDGKRQFLGMVQYSIALAMAGPNRMLVHGAAVGHGGRAILAVGPTGVGKSTLAAAALTGGWSLLADDLAVVKIDQQATSISVRGVQRPPMFPAAMAEEHGLDGAREPGPRGRVRLSPDVLDPDCHQLIGMVMVDHDEGDGSAEPVDSSKPELQLIDDCLAVPALAPVVRRHLAPAAALLGLPAAILRHSADPMRRLERCRQLLDQVFDHFSGST